MSTTLSEHAQTIKDTLENATCGLSDTGDMFSFEKEPASTINNKYRLEITGEVTREMTGGYVECEGGVDIYIAKLVRQNKPSFEILKAQAVIAETIESELYKAFPGTVFTIDDKKFTITDSMHMLIGISCSFVYERQII